MIENITRFIGVLHLNSANYASTNTNVIVTFLLNPMFFGTLSRYELMITTPNLIWCLFVGINVAYDHPLTTDVILMHSFCVFLCVSICHMLNMVIMHLAVLT